MIRLDMLFIDRMERRLGWLSFPGFLRYYALFQVLVFVLQLLRPGVADILEFDRAAILSGEVWRVFTFLFAASAAGSTGLFSIIFLFFMVMIAFMVSDALEGAWGVFRTSLFHYCGIIGIIAANFLYGGTSLPVGSGMFLYESAFFAFATLFPRMEILLFFFPVQVRFIAIAVAAMMLLPVLSAPLILPFFILGFANYLIFAGVPAMRGQLKVREAGNRQKRFKAGKAPAGEPFHECAVCHRTDISDPSLEFRIGMDDKEYCNDHLPSA